MDLSYGALNDPSPDHTVEGPIHAVVGVTFISIQHQVDGDDSRTVMSSPPFLEGVSPETPNLWSARCNFEPVVANEEEVVRPFLKPGEQWAAWVPNEGPSEYVSKDFGRNARGYERSTTNFGRV